MSLFDPAESLILASEGVWSITPGDSGGETCFGIDMKSNPTWPGWPRCHELLAAGTRKSEWHLDAVLMPFVHRFYHELWDSLHGDQTDNQSLATAIFGGVVNQGPQRVIRMVQTCACALGQDVKIDGILGQATVAACNACPSAPFLFMLQTLRRAAYITTAAFRPKDRQFLQGWFNRLDSGA